VLRLDNLQHPPRSSTKMDNSFDSEARSSPPSQPVEAPLQLPSLPTEILQHIIQLSLPRLSFKTFRERYDILLNSCLVNKLWAVLAQRELFRHVWCTEEGIFQVYYAEKGDTKLPTHSLWLRGSDTLSATTEYVAGLSGLRLLYMTTHEGQLEFEMSMLLHLAPGMSNLSARMIARR
jgi:hypothetical protein